MEPVVRIALVGWVRTSDTGPKEGASDLRPSNFAIGADLRSALGRAGHRRVWHRRLAIVLATMLAAAGYGFAAGASSAYADWYWYGSYVNPGAVVEGYNTNAYADYAEITPNRNQPNGYVCSGTNISWISWTCGWDTTTNNWGTWTSPLNPECQNGEWYGFDMDCYVWNGT